MEDNGIGDVEEKNVQEQQKDSVAVNRRRRHQKA